MKVHVVIYEHRHGTSVSAYSTAEAAEQARLDIAANWWDTEIATHHPKPTDPKELADVYFEIIDDELFHIHELEVL